MKASVSGNTEGWIFTAEHLHLMHIPPIAAFPFPFQTSDGSILFGPFAVIAVICALWLVATIFAFSLYFQYSAAGALIQRLKKEPEMLTGDDSRLAGIAAYASTKGNFARAARELGSCKSSAEVRELVSQVAVREESRGAVAFLSFAVGSVLILGLMGTFLAFAELVNSSDLGGDAFQQGIKNVLQHLNLAFYASIAGVGASITLLLLSTVFIRPKRQLLLADFEDLLVNSHLESVRSGFAAAEGTESGDLFETLRKLSSNLSLAVDSIRTVATRFEKFSQTAPESMAETLEAVKVEIANGHIRYAELLTISTATKDAVAGISGEAAKVLGEMLKVHGERQIEVYSQANEFSRRLLIEIGEKDAERLKTYRDGISGVADKVADLALGWESRSQELVTAFKAERTDYINHLKDAGEKSAASFEAVSKNSHVAIEKISKTMTESCGKVAQEAIGRLEAAYQAGIADWTQSAEIAKLQNTTLGETLAILDQRLAPMAASLGDLYAEAGKTLAEAGNTAVRIAEVPGHLDRITTSHVGAIGALTTEAANMSETVRNLSSDAGGVFDKAGNNLARLSSQLDTLIEIGRQSGYNLDAPRGRKFTAWAKRLFTRK